jgi:hypothetical protein
MTLSVSDCLMMLCQLCSSSIDGRMRGAVYHFHAVHLWDCDAGLWTVVRIRWISVHGLECYGPRLIKFKHELMLWIKTQCTRWARQTLQGYVSWELFVKRTRIKTKHSFCGTVPQPGAGSQQQKTLWQTFFVLSLRAKILSAEFCGSSWWLLKRFYFYAIDVFMWSCRWSATFRTNVPPPSSEDCTASQPEDHNRHLHRRENPKCWKTKHEEENKTKQKEDYYYYYYYISLYCSVMLWIT